MPSERSAPPTRRAPDALVARRRRDAVNLARATGGAKLAGCPRVATGTADLPLHGGRVPAWLASRMARLGRVIVEAIAHEYGRTEVLRRLAEPVLVPVVRRRDGDGLALVRDHHQRDRRAQARARRRSSTSWACTSAAAAAAHSRRTPDELTALGERVGLDAPALVRASRLVAKVDSAAVQDGFELYLHGFIVADDGAWVGGAAGDERRATPGPALPLALGPRGRGRSSRSRTPRSRGARSAEMIVNLTDRRAGGARGEMLGLGRAAGRRRWWAGWRG